MRKFLQVELLIRVLASLLLIPTLGISVRPHLVNSSFTEAGLAASFHSYQSASTHLLKVTAFYPWRGDLWEIAGLFALKGNDPTLALESFGKASKLGQLSTESEIAWGDAYFEVGDVTNAIRQWQTARAAVAGDEMEIIERLLKAHQSEKNYASIVDDIKALIALNPNDASLYYQLGLNTAALQPESALAYLGQAADLDESYSSAANTIRRSVNTGRLSGEPAYMYLLVGRALASLDEWDLAVEAFRQATIARPDYSEAWAFLAEARQHLPAAEEFQDQVLAELEYAHQLDPDSLAANSFLALYWQRLKQPETALEYLRTAASLDPSNPTFPLEIGNTLSELGDLPAAQAAYEQAIELAPELPLYRIALAEFAIRHQMQLRELALPAAQRAYELDSEDPASLVVLGKTYYFLEEYELALGYLQEALAINPDYAQAHLQLGMVYLVQGDLQLAAQSLQLARQHADTALLVETIDRLLDQYFP